MTGNLWRRAALLAIAMLIGGAVQGQSTMPQDNQVTQPNSGAPKSTPPAPAPGRHSAPMNASQQDHVTASRADPDTGAQGTGLNRAVPAPKQARTAHPATHPRASPAPAAQSQPGSTADRTPVESHSAIQQNPKLPTHMPPAQGAPNAPPPNQHPEQPQR